MKAGSAEILRSMRWHGLVLALFALAAVLLLAGVRELTRENIAAQREEAERQALRAVLPEGLRDADLERDVLPLHAEAGWTGLERLGLEEAGEALRFLRAGAVVAVVLPLRSRQGYSGPILLRVGILPDGRLSGVRVLAHRETPGLGDPIELRVSDWILDFDGRSLEDPQQPRWTVRKDGGDFDQFVGATVTPRAVVHAVRDALLFFRDNRAALLNSP